VQNYQLKPHVRACVDGANLVFLDLRRDRYRAVPVRGAPPIAGLTDGVAANNAIEQGLVALDLIETAAVQSGPGLQRSRAPERKLVPGQDGAPTLSDVASFTRSCVGASHALRARRLDLTLARLAKRKAKLRGGSPPAERVAAMFETLRPWYPRERVCLFDSLALMGFMLARGLRPTLVLGVRTTPFAAHCWIEFDDMLVSDTSDHCASFTPIAWV